MLAIQRRRTAKMITYAAVWMFIVETHTCCGLLPVFIHSETDVGKLRPGGLSLERTKDDLPAGALSVARALFHTHRITCALSTPLRPQ